MLIYIVSCQYQNHIFLVVRCLGFNFRDNGSINGINHLIVITVIIIIICIVITDITVIINIIFIVSLQRCGNGRQIDPVIDFCHFCRRRLCLINGGAYSNLPFNNGRLIDYGAFRATEPFSAMLALSFLAVELTLVAEMAGDSISSSIDSEFVLLTVSATIFHLFYYLFIIYTNF